MKRLHPALCSVDLIQLSHWHRDHSGGLLRAIRMVNHAKQAKGIQPGVIADVHPARPEYRGFSLGEKIVSLQADPTFDELEAAGATVSKQDKTHTVLDNMFLISGEIPRLTPYETGLKGAMRFDREEDDWFSDEAIADERFLMCNLKGASQTRSAVYYGIPFDPSIVLAMTLTQIRQGNRDVHRLQPCWCRQRRETCGNSDATIRAPSCCRWRLSSGLERT